MRKFIESRNPVRDFMRFLSAINAKAIHGDTEHIRALFIHIDKLSVINRWIVNLHMWVYHRSNAWIFRAWRQYHA